MKKFNFFSTQFKQNRLRRRERNLWADTPIAKLFTPQSGKILKSKI